VFTDLCKQLVRESRTIARMRYRFLAPLWQYPGPGGWHFVTLPGDVAEQIEAEAGPRRGFGSVRVAATIGETTWNTSIFPDRESESFLLPVKRQVRAAEGVAEGDTVEVVLELDTR
jgi:hypothetical protein